MRYPAVLTKKNEMMGCDWLNEMSGYPEWHPKMAVLFPYSQKLSFLEGWLWGTLGHKPFMDKPCVYFWQEHSTKIIQ